MAGLSLVMGIVRSSGLAWIVAVLVAAPSVAAAMTLHVESNGVDAAGWSR